MEQALYDSVIAGNFPADMPIEGAVMAENKSVQAIAAAHEVQWANNPTATGIEVNLLLHFGSAGLEINRRL